MDPLGNLYFYNEGTMQTTRQHPMDGYHPISPLYFPFISPIFPLNPNPNHLILIRYYQSLYRKLRLQRTQAGGVAGGASRRTSTLSSRSSTLSGASSTAGVATKRGGGGRGAAALSSSRPAGGWGVPDSYQPYAQDRRKRPRPRAPRAP